MFINPLRTVALAAAVIAISVQPAFADRRNFRVFNRTSVDINSLYVSPSGARNWEEDVLGRDVLEAGTSTLINFRGNSSACRYDIRAEFKDGDVVEDYKINICNIDSYTFREGR